MKEVLELTENVNISKIIFSFCPQKKIFESKEQIT